MAVTLRRQLPTKVVFHADRCTQFTSAQIADTAADLGVLRSMGRTGVCWENGVNLRSGRRRFPTRPAYATPYWEVVRRPSFYPLTNLVVQMQVS